MGRISVVIPVYNSEKTIIRALDSVFVQTFKNFEVVVVNDGSTDRTEDILRGYLGQEKKVKCIHQRNNGPAAARNRGVEESQGEYVAFLDADDVWEKDKLKEQVEVLDQNPEMALVFTDMQHVVNGKSIHTTYLHERGYRHVASGRVYNNLVQENFIFTPTVLVRRKVLDAVGGFDERMKIAEDYDLWLRIARDYMIFFLDRPLVIRHRTGNNITNDRYVYFKSNIALRKRLMELDKGNPETLRLIRRQLQMDQFHFGYFLFDSGKMSEARKIFIKIFLSGRYSIKAIFYVVVSLFPASWVSFLRTLKRRGVK